MHSINNSLILVLTHKSQFERDMHKNTRSCKRRRRNHLFVRCWPFFSDWLHVDDVNNIATTSKEYYQYSRTASRAWPSTLLIQPRDFHFPSKSLQTMLSICSTGEKRIKLDFNGLHHHMQLDVETSEVFFELRRLGIEKIDLEYSSDYGNAIMMCKFLRPKHINLSSSVHAICDFLFESLDVCTESLNLSNIKLTRNNTRFTSLGGLSSLKKLRCLNLSGLDLVNDKNLALFQHLPDLTDMDLSNCRNITSYQHLNPNLRKLNLSRCGNVDDPVGLGNLTKLEYLDMCYCDGINLEEYGTRTIAHMTRLRVLNLDSNYHIMHVDEFLPKSLESIDLTSCFRVEARSLIAAFQRLTNLRSLQIESCNQTMYSEVFESIPEGIEDLVCTFENEHVSFQNLKHLKHIRSVSCHLDNAMNGFSLQYMAQSISHLTHLELNECAHVVDKYLMPLENAQNLESLIFSDCNQIGDSFFQTTVKKLTKLHTLSVDFSNVTSAGFESLSTLVRLKTLDLYFSHMLKGDFLRYTPPAVSSLRIAGCPITNSTLKHVPSTLVNLDISECPVTDVSIRYLCKCPQLTRLNVNVGQFSSYVLQKLQAKRPGLVISYDDC